ncbi:hypothetical protein E2C01_025619 [Portunus trituberculatus]|uniref:Uncharacterized protein n=1 Tax=Portunus trituberculatus TaxID=210409 RepID=A0A5B7EGE9_PORTR|nr:hypothetical protein [Portunus trituberculatus]
MNKGLLPQCCDVTMASEYADIDASSSTQQQTLRHLRNEHLQCRHKTSLTMQRNTPRYHNITSAPGDEGEQSVNRARGEPNAFT